MPADRPRQNTALLLYGDNNFALRPTSTRLTSPEVVASQGGTLTSHLTNLLQETDAEDDCIEERLGYQRFARQRPADIATDAPAAALAREVATAEAPAASADVQDGPSLTLFAALVQVFKLVEGEWQPVRPAGLALIGGPTPKPFQLVLYEPQSKRPFSITTVGEAVCVPSELSVSLVDDSRQTWLLTFGTHAQTTNLLQLLTLVRAFAELHRRTPDVTETVLGGWVMQDVVLGSGSALAPGDAAGVRWRRWPMPRALQAPPGSPDWRGSGLSSPLGEIVDASGEEARPHKLTVPLVTTTQAVTGGGAGADGFEQRLVGMAKGGIRYVARAGSGMHARSGSTLFHSVELLKMRRRESRIESRPTAEGAAQAVAPAHVPVRAPARTPAHACTAARPAARSAERNATAAPPSNCHDERRRQEQKQPDEVEEDEGARGGGSMPSSVVELFEQGRPPQQPPMAPRPPATADGSLPARAEGLCMPTSLDELFCRAGEERLHAADTARATTDTLARRPVASSPLPTVRCGRDRTPRSLPRAARKPPAPPLGAAFVAASTEGTVAATARAWPTGRLAPRCDCVLCFFGLEHLE